MKDENYFSVQGWMRTDLDLKGNELMCYALIHGFSQAEGNYFTGSIDYLCDWLGCSKKTTFRTLQSLVDKGLLNKTDLIVNNIKYCKYKTLKVLDKMTPLGTNCVNTGQNVQDDGQNVLRGGVKTTPNNILNNIDNNIVIKKEERFNFRKELLDFGFNETLLNDWLDIRKSRKGRNSESAFNIFINRVKKSKYKPNQILETMVYKSWTSFEEDWIDNLQPKQNVKKSQDELLREKFSKMPSQLGL